MKIKDEGIGIPQNEYNKIFQRFYRSNHSYVKQTEGSGVGLYLTRMILERQGGLIRVESVPEKEVHLFYNLGTDKRPEKFRPFVIQR